MGNLLSSGPAEDISSQLGDPHLLPALCALARAYLPSHPALARESAWVLNNLTGQGSDWLDHTPQGHAPITGHAHRPLLGSQLSVKD